MSASLGNLEVHLVSACDLKDEETFGKMSPYVVFTCCSQEKKSGVAKGGDTNPEWNETVLFPITGHSMELECKVMNKNTLSSDDHLGKVTIPLECVVKEGCIPPRSYKICGEKVKGELKLGLNFKPQHGHSSSSCHHSKKDNECHPHSGDHKSHHHGHGSGDKEHHHHHRHRKSGSGSSSGSD